MNDRIPKPMLATPGPLPQGPGWAYEVKWDGYRAILIDGRYYSRTGLRLTGPVAPVLAEAVDGELVAFDGDGRPSFHAMQTGIPPAFVAFDLVLPGLDYARRRERLEGIPGLTISPGFTDRDGTIAAAKELGLEGVMAKRLDSLYRPGTRSPDWIKWKFVKAGDFVIGGWRPGERKLGSLLVGTPGPEGLSYRGRVGGGITAATEAALLPVLHELARSDSPFTGPHEKGNFVEPLLVVEVRYSEITPDGRLRFPIFLRMRPDKPASECFDES